MSAQVAMVKADKQDRSGIHLSQRNTSWMGLDFHLPVFLISAVLVIVLVVATLVMPQWFNAPLLELRVWITTKFDWYFLLLVDLFLLFAAGVIFFEARVTATASGPPRIRMLSQ